MTTHNSKASSSSQCLGENFDQDDPRSSYGFAAAVGGAGLFPSDVFIEVGARMHYYGGPGTGIGIGIPLLGGL